MYNHPNLSYEITIQLMAGVDGKIGVPEAQAPGVRPHAHA